MFSVLILLFITVISDVTDGATFNMPFYTLILSDTLISNKMYPKFTKL